MHVLDSCGVDQRWVGGAGPMPAKLAYVAEAPAKNEIREGIPLVGPAGEINWQLSQRYARIGRQGAYVTNWSKLPLTDMDKKRLMSPEGAEEKAQWTGLLEEELKIVQPKLVIALGAWSVEALLGPGHALYWTNGLAFTRPDGITVACVTHPAAGMREDNGLQKTADGYAGVRALLEGKLKSRRLGEWKPSPPTERWEGISPMCYHCPMAVNHLWKIAIDTEGSKEEPFCLTFATCTHHAYIIYAEEREKLARFFRMIRELDLTLVFHNAIHDADVLLKMGLDIWDGFKIIDTIILAFVLQDLPLGLKPLTQRLQQVQMHEYPEVVRPWKEKAEAVWLGEAYKHALPLTAYEPQRTPKGRVRMSKGQPVLKRVGEETALRLVRHYERGQQLSPQEEAWAAGKIGQKRPGWDLKLVPEELAREYAGRDACVTLGTEGLLTPRVDAEGLRAVSDLDHEKMLLVSDMQRCGMHIDINRYWEVLGIVTGKKLAAAAAVKAIVQQECTGGMPDEWVRDFNPGSSEQVEEFCHFIYKRDDKLRLVKRTKSQQRFSTDNSVLAMLKQEHPFVDHILTYREYDKYEGTYLLPLQGLIRQVGPQEWRLFPNLRTTAVVSGRLSAHKPNALAWPAYDDDALLRSPFTAPPGWKLVSWDLSQIELRILAAKSKDPVLTEAFVKGLDLHTNLASKIFGVPYDRVDKLTQRTPAKNTHYMMVYQGGYGKLYEMCRVRLAGFTVDDAKRIMDETKKLYRVAMAYIRSKGDDVRMRGYVSNTLGRRRFLAGCRLSGDKWPVLGLRLEADRQAGNFDIQADAGDMLGESMKTVYREVYPECKRRGLGFRLWLQIHDELMGQVRPEHFAIVDRLVQAAMTQASPRLHPIPVITQGKLGDSWAELKD